MTASSDVWRELIQAMRSPCILMLVIMLEEPQPNGRSVLWSIIISHRSHGGHCVHRMSNPSGKGATASISGAQRGDDTHLSVRHRIDRECTADRVLPYESMN